MWAIFILLLVHIACAEPVPSANAEGQVSSPLDDELASMSKELDGMDDTPVEQQEESPQAEASPEQSEKDVSQVAAETPVKRYVDVEPGETLALVQYNVAPQIISTRPGDKVAILDEAAIDGKTPCPTTTTDSPAPRMFCNSCGKKNPKERGEITSYIDVDNSRECAGLCARYIAKGKPCDVWEYHGEWRNKQCFLLHIPDFPGCKGDVGQVGDMAFESGTCFEGTDGDDQPDLDNVAVDDGLESLGSDELMEASSMDAGSDGVPSWFPRMEASVGNGFSNGASWKVSVGAMIFLIGGIATFRGLRKPQSADYAKLIDNTDEV